MSEARVSKQHILEEIKRTAQEHGAAALGWRRFYTETGIKYSDWHGKYWVRWSEAVHEAGFEANEMKEAYSEKGLIEKLIPLIRRLGRFPVFGDLKMMARNDPEFPSDKSFSGLGPKQEWAS